MAKCVISDLGRVLVFFDNAVFYKKMADHCPYSPEEIRQSVALSEHLLALFDSGKITSREFYDRAVEVLKAEIGIDEFFGIYTDVFWLNPPVLDLYRALKSETRLILLSNTDVERYRFIRRTFPEIFIFDDYVLSYEVGVIKPHPDIYKEAVRRSGFSPGNCVFVDDLEKNTAAAESLGIPSVLYAPRSDLKGELESRGIHPPGGGCSSDLT